MKVLISKKIQGLSYWLIKFCYLIGLAIVAFFILYFSNLKRLESNGIPPKQLFPDYALTLTWVADHFTIVIGLLSLAFLFFLWILLKDFNARIRWRKEYLLLGSVLLIGLCSGEFLLRKVGFDPGKVYRSHYFQAVDSLVEKKGHIADSLGIFKVDPSARTEIKNRIAEALLKKECIPQYKLNPKETYEVFNLVPEFMKVHCEQLGNEFTTKVKELKTQDPDTWSKLDSAIWAYSFCPINQDGFKSIAFQKYPNAKKSILLLGDSFTWGHSTSSKTNSFADALLAQGYAVYNTGISGTDPVQYEVVAKKFIPILQPDVVIVNFYLGNDVQYYKRSAKPFQPTFFATNAGNLMSFYNGVECSTVDEAYDMAIKMHYLDQNQLLRRWCSSTCISTLSYHVLD